MDLEGELVDLLLGCLNSEDPQGAFRLSQRLAELKEGNLNFQQVCCDVIWSLDCYVEGEQRAAFVRVVSYLWQNEFISTAMAIEGLDVELLGQCRIISDPEGFSKRLIRLNTSNSYRQVKFNAFREQSAGYALLMQGCSCRSPNFGSIVSLIGRYSLDPVRCIDLLIDALSAKSPISVCEFAAFFRRVFFGVRASENLASALVEKERSFENEGNRINVLRLTAGCLVESLVPLPLFLSFYRGQLLQVSNFLAQMEHHLEEKPLDSSNFFTNSKPENSPQREKIPAAVLLVVALLEASQLEMALETIGTVAVGANRHPLVARWLGNILFEELRECRFEVDRFLLILSLLGDNLSLHPALISCILRYATEKVAEPGACADWWIAVVVEYILPGITCLESANPSISEDLFCFLQRFSFKTRFYVFGRWKALGGTQLTRLALRRGTIVGKKLLRRLSKDNAREIGRSLGKLISTVPFAIFKIALEQVQAYENFQQPVCDAFRYLGRLGYELLIFCLVDTLCSPDRDRLKSDGTNVSDWLSHLAIFTGAVYKKYSNCDFAPIVLYILLQLGRGVSADLVVLEELLLRIAGAESISDISEAQLEALISGPAMREELVGPVSDGKVSKRSTLRLLAVLEESGNVVTLWTVLAQQRFSLLLENDFSHLKLISGLLDASQQCFLQYLDVCSAVMAQALKDAEAICKCSHVDRYIVDLSLKERRVEDSTLERLFWSTSVQSIFYPSERYATEIARLESNSDKKSLLSRLRDEQHELQQSIGKFINQCFNEQQRGQYFQEIEGNPEFFFLRCLLPRCTFSVIEATFCVKFLSLLQAKPLSLHAVMIEWIPKLSFSFTASEASSVSRLLRYALEQFQEYFLTDPDRFFAVSNKAVVSFGACLSSREFMQIRNSLLLLTGVISLFPATKEHAIYLEQQLCEVRDDPREDLKVMANRYLSMLSIEREKLPYAGSAYWRPAIATEEKLALEQRLRQKLQEELSLTVDVEKDELAESVAEPSPGPRSPLGSSDSRSASAGTVADVQSESVSPSYAVNQSEPNLLDNLCEPSNDRARSDQPEQTRDNYECYPRNRRDDVDRKRHRPDRHSPDREYRSTSHSRHYRDGNSRYQPRRYDDKHSRR